MSNFKSVVKKKHRKNAYDGSGGVDPTYLADVIDKLKNHPDYKTKSAEELRQVAKRLSDTEELREFFSHLTCDPYEQHCVEIEQEKGASFGHSREVQQAQDRAVRRLQPLPVKLFLFELRTPTSRFFSRFSSLFAFKYGPLHAAIQIGDMVLQWGTTSLVIPERYDPGDPIFQTDFKHATVGAEVTARMQPKVVEAVENMNYSEQIELQFEHAIGMEDMIEKVKKVVVRYNRNYYYNVVLRNCQTFVDDVMKEIGVKNAPQKLTGKLQEYFKLLTAKKSKTIPSDLPTHEDLDKYVRDLDMSTLTKHDKEYLLCLYFQFHLEAMKTEKDPEEMCRVEGCRMEMIERELEEMILEKAIVE